MTRKNNQATFYLAVFGVCFLCIAAGFAAAMLYQANRDYAPTNGAPRDHVAFIRDYLRDELPTGQWEEIRWESDNQATTLHYRTENPMGGMTRQLMTVEEVPEDLELLRVKGRNGGCFRRDRSRKAPVDDPREAAELKELDDLFNNTPFDEFR